MPILPGASAAGAATLGFISSVSGSSERKILIENFNKILAGFGGNIDSVLETAKKFKSKDPKVNQIIKSLEVIKRTSDKVADMELKLTSQQKSMMITVLKRTGEQVKSLKKITAKTAGLDKLDISGGLKRIIESAKEERRISRRQRFDEAFAPGQRARGALSVGAAGVGGALGGGAGAVLGLSIGKLLGPVLEKVGGSLTKKLGRKLFGKTPEEIQLEEEQQTRKEITEELRKISENQEHQISQTDEVMDEARVTRKEEKEDGTDKKLSGLLKLLPAAIGSALTKIAPSLAKSMGKAFAPLAAGAIGFAAGSAIADKLGLKPGGWLWEKITGGEKTPKELEEDRLLQAAIKKSRGVLREKFIEKFASDKSLVSGSALTAKGRKTLERERLVAHGRVGSPLERETIKAEIRIREAAKAGVGPYGELIRKPSETKRIGSENKELLDIQQKIFEEIKFSNKAMEVTTAELIRASAQLAAATASGSSIGAVPQSSDDILTNIVNSVGF